MLNSGTSVTPTLSVQCSEMAYAYRRFGVASEYPLVCLQHFMGTLDNWDPAVIDALAKEREVILFDNAGVGRSDGAPASTVGDMTQHLWNFMQGLGINVCDVLGFSLGGMIAQQLALDHPHAVHRLVLVGTAPRGGDEIMHLEKPSLAPYLSDPTLQGFARLQKLFFAPSASSQAAGAAFVERLEQRKIDREPPAGAGVAQAQMRAFDEWRRFSGQRFADLKGIAPPTLVINGVYDEMIPVRNSYWLAENLPNAMLTVFPDSAHGSLFQFHEAFSSQVSRFLSSTSAWAPS